MSQKLKTLKEKLRQAIYLELLEYDNLNTRKEKELEERINLFVEKNTPTNPSKWSYYKSQAKKKFDVYPSAYANAWAAKKYKAAGGGWRKSENIEEASMTGNLDGGEGPPKTPYAFQSKKKRAQDKKKEDEISTNSTGFTKVNEDVYIGFYKNKQVRVKARSDKHASKQIISKLKIPKWDKDIASLLNLTKNKKNIQKFESINEAKGWKLLNNVLLKFSQHQTRRLALAIKNKNEKQTREVVNLLVGGLQAAMKSTLDKRGFQLDESINEGKYHQWRNDESLSPKQKIGRSMREVRDSLNGLSKTIDMSVRLKNELKVDTTDYWKTTHKALGKISERLVKLANKVGKLQ